MKGKKVKDKILKLLNILNEGLVDKESVMKIGLLTLLAGENIVLLGPPGTAKSEVARRLSQVIDEGSYFEYLLTKFTTPEELFGPLSIKNLKNDVFSRKIKGYLPEVKVAFLDEVFKANSSILNSLLTIINEKKYHNGNVEVKVPLISLIGASNEFPKEEELSALYDRFLVKKEVGYIENSQRVRLLNLNNSGFSIPNNLKLTISEIENIQREYDKIIIPDKISRIIIKIIQKYENYFKNQKDEVEISEKVSDRKIVKISKLLKVAAYTNGRNEVDISDLLLLNDCLWNDPKNSPVVYEIIGKTVEQELMKIF
ncbi:AAA family ATPase [Leptotrichia massiliensis]|uniref:AAA family ATPase n=1 Tax=Leptotrichia massiliensis TaxID=1852388 RepID=UPI0028D79822|nr:AAA family ATPase [Leptotrichia massiliensis]